MGKKRLLILSIFMISISAFLFGCVASQSNVVEAVAVPEVKSNIPAGQKTGTWPTYPNKPLVTKMKTAIILKGEPKVTMIDDWKARITFVTAVPTRAATVYYGVYDQDATAKFAWPRLREFVKEKRSGATKHSVVLDLNKTKKKKVDIANFSGNGGGVVAYRIELYNPKLRIMETPAAVHYDRRFEFYNGKIFPTVTEGPFVDLITETSAVISWDTDKPSTGTVKLKGLSDQSTSSSKANHFEVKLTNLTPGTTYTYCVQVTDGQNTSKTREYSFNTPAKNLKEFNFCALGDSRAGAGGAEYSYNGVNATVLRALATDAFKRDAAFIIHTGDMVNGYSSDPLDFRMQLESYKDVMEQIKHYIPTYEMIGNHEVVVRTYQNIKGAPYGGFLMFEKEGKDSGAEIFRQEFVNPENGPVPDNVAAKVPSGKSLPPYKESVYYFDYGNCRFVMMNNNYWYSGLPEKFGGNLEGYILDDQMKWILEIFAKTQVDKSIDHLFIYAQEPLFPAGWQHTSGMWYQGGDPEKNGGNDRTHVSERRDQIWSAFIATGKVAVAQFGDEHNYSRALITKDRNGQPFKQPVWHIVSGGAGAPFANVQTGLPWDEDVKMTTQQYNYTLYKVRGKKIFLEAYNIDGMLIDSIQVK